MGLCFCQLVNRYRELKGVQYKAYLSVVEKYFHNDKFITTSSSATHHHDMPHRMPLILSVCRSFSPHRYLLTSLNQISYQISPSPSTPNQPHHTPPNTKSLWLHTPVPQSRLTPHARHTMRPTTPASAQRTTCIPILPPSNYASNLHSHHPGTSHLHRDNYRTGTHTQIHTFYSKTRSRISKRSVAM
jgi:hypothetical protein